MSGNQRTYGEGFRERGLGTEEVEAIVVMVVPAFVLRVVLCTECASGICAVYS